MAYTVKLGTFAKKINSTAQPDMTGWAEFSVVLKQGSELTDPTLQLNVNESDIVNYNYAYIFGSYYWITSRKMVRTDLCELKLEKDVLASYKLEIGNSNLYIARSSVSYDGSIKDNFYPMIAQRTIANDTILDNTQINLNDGVYVVNITGKNKATAVSTLYVMTPTEFSQLVRKLYEGMDTLLGGNWFQQLANAILDPQEYIRSVLWLPFSLSTINTSFGYISTSPDTLYCGLWDSQIQSRYLSKCAATVGSWTIPITKHPQAYRGAYLNGAPYTDHIIEYPPFGTIHLNPEKLIDSENVLITLSVDAVTGMGILEAAGDNNTGILASASAQYGVPIPLSAATTNFSGAASGMIGLGTAIAGLATANPIMAISGAVSSISSLTSAAQSNVSTTGHAGSMACFQVPKYFYTTYYKITPEDNPNNGRPLCQVTQPALLGGYMIAQKPTISISAPLPEQQKISQFLTTGFYYE